MCRIKLLSSDLASCLANCRSYEDIKVKGQRSQETPADEKETTVMKQRGKYVISFWINAICYILKTSFSRHVTVDGCIYHGNTQQ